MEDSLERVMELVKHDLGDDEEDSVEGDFEGLEEQPPPQVREELLRILTGLNIQKADQA